MFENQIIGDETVSRPNKLYALGIISTVQALITGYIGCSAIWFRSKSWTQIQMLMQVLVEPFLLLAYILKRVRVDTNEPNGDEFCEYMMIALFALGIALIFFGYKYLEVLRKELADKSAADATLNINLRSSPRAGPSSLTGVLFSGSYPKVCESHWNLAPFGRLNTIQELGSADTLTSSCPSVNLIINPNEKLAICKPKDSLAETHV